MQSPRFLLCLAQQRIPSEQLKQAAANYSNAANLLAVEFRGLLRLWTFNQVLAKLGKDLVVLNLKRKAGIMMKCMESYSKSICLSFSPETTDLPSS